MEMLLDSLPTGEQQPGDDHPPVDVVSQTGDLARAAVMKEVVGPHLDALLRPVYAPEFTEREARELELSKVFLFRHLIRPCTSAIHVLLKRRLKEVATFNSHHTDLLRLDAKRPELLYHHGQPERIFNEAISGSVITPLTLAAQIYRVENGAPSGDDPYFVDDGDALDVEDLIEIMRRPIFDEMLLRLTKGPNGFLGNLSIQFVPESLNFFSFSQRAKDALRWAQVYVVEDGRVVGFSDEFHLAAQRRRQELRERHEMRPESTHEGADSSGCPVRHSFEDASGDKQEPLIITAKKFVMAALRLARDEHQTNVG